jgi:hypothetical protein
MEVITTETRLVPFGAKKPLLKNPQLLTGIKATV